MVNSNKIIKQWYGSQPGAEVVAAAYGDVDPEIRALLEGRVPEPSDLRDTPPLRPYDYKYFGRLSKTERNLGR